MTMDPTAGTRRACPPGRGAERGAERRAERRAEKVVPHRRR